MKIKYEKKLIIVCIIFGVSVLSRICLSNYLISENQKLKTYYSKKEYFKKEISKLSLLDYQLSSLNYVEGKAYDLGFISLDEPLLSLEHNVSVPMASLSSH